MTHHSPHQLLRDSLTGALTRHRFEALLGHAIESTPPEGQLALLIIDIDHFKSVNDSFGHARGDRVLVETVRRMRRVLRNDDMLFRFGGDEFAVLLPQTDREQAQQIGEALLAAVKDEPFNGPPLLTLSLSIGIALYPHDAATTDGLFEVADRRAYQAKRAGRGQAVALDLHVEQERFASPERLLERDEILLDWRDFLDGEGESARAFCLRGLRSSGRTRLLDECERAATARGFAILAVRGSVALRARSYGAVIESARQWPVHPLAQSMRQFADALSAAIAARGATRLLITIDDPQMIDTASLEMLRELMLLPNLPPLLVAYVDGVAWARRPPLDTPPHTTANLTALSAPSITVWLRQILRWEPPAEVVAWVAAASEGLPGHIHAAIGTLFDHGALVRRDELGGWTWQPHLVPRLAARSETIPPIVGLLHSAPLLVGRDDEVSRLRALIGDARLVTVVGQGGIGKTRLALQVAAESAAEFRDGVYFVPLAAVAAASHIPAAIAAVLQLPPAVSSDLQTQLIAYLRSRNLLLVLDNLEHLFAGAQFFAELLHHLPDLHLLATSRERLGLAGEQVLVLEGLAHANPQALPATSAAVQLFLQRAHEVYPMFAPSSSDLIAIDQICRLLNGLPLGIELAASWTTSYDCAAILAELERSIAFLTSDRAEIPARHRSITAVLDSFWDLLSAPEREALQSLALFRGGFTREAALAVAAASPFFLDGLVAKTFLRRTPQGRFEMHELLRQYAAEHLQQRADGVARVADRHSAYYLELITRAYAHADDQANSLEAQAVELDNLRAAWNWAVAQGHVAQIALALNALDDLMTHLGLLREELEMIDSTVQRLTTPELGPAERMVLAHLTATRGIVLQYMGLYRESLLAIQAAEQLRNGLAARHVEARVYFTAGVAEMNLGNHAIARDYLEAALALCDSDERLAVRCLVQLTHQANFVGNGPQSSRCAEEALRRARAAGYHRDEIRALTYLGIGLIFQERHAEALSALEQVLALHRPSRHAYVDLLALINLAQLLWEMQDYVRAEATIERSLWMTRNVDMRHLEGLAFRVQGLIAMTTGEMALAEAAFDTALAIFGTVKTERDRARAYAERALWLCRCAQYDRALAESEQALKLAHHYNIAVVIGHAEIHRGQIFSALGDLAAAAAAYQAGYERMVSLGRHNRASEALAGLALVQARQGDQQAAQHHALAITNHLARGRAALGGMFDPAAVLLTVKQILHPAYPREVQPIQAAGQALITQLRSQYSPERAERAIAHNPALRMLSDWSDPALIAQ